MTTYTHPCAYCGGALLPKERTTNTGQRLHTLQCAACGDVAYAAVDIADLNEMVSNFAPVT